MKIIKDRILKPKIRSRLRRSLGKIFYINKRRIEWLREFSNYSKVIRKDYFDHSVVRHKSLLLRPLKDVDMRLQHNKVKNLSLAINKIDGIIIKPNQVFSLWYLIGKPSARKGYLPGLVLNQGKIEEGIGGGLCQLGNLLCWMSLHTPLEIKERYRHGYDVFPDVNRKIPFGSGATLAYNYIDFQLRNTTPHTFQIKLNLSEKYLEGEILSSEIIPSKYEVFEDNHHFVQQSWGGYTRHNQIKRRIIEDNNVKEELLFENHAIMMYEPFLES
ncbi:VanW family protein [Fulvivirga lutea]|uniref:VanW family protein n=1 Tax=Fulvivirga lutea TaxID=2810512 RepID=A0A974WIH5_9BACT|nr:VanW family protein [Fulvivirga lutea]QSE99179.1 VanW family protein [Fulvivirga lutea]